MKDEIKKASKELATAMKSMVTNPDLKTLETEAMGNFVMAPILRAMFNVGGLEDVPTGKIVKGVSGENIIWGGYAHVNSIVGGGNCYKSEQILELFCAMLGRYLSARGIFFDTENTMQYERLERALQKHFHTQFYDIMTDSLLPANQRKLTFVQQADMDGDQFVEELRKLAGERAKNKRSAHPKEMVTCPTRNPNGTLMQMQAPMGAVIDSLSMFSTASVMEKTVESNKIGDAKNNTIFMKDGASKTQFFIQLPGITTNGDIFMGLVAHLGHYIEMDPYAPKPLKLTFQKNGTKLKGVPEKFSFINNLVQEVHSVAKLVHRQDKSPLYPGNAADKNSGNDLMQINAFSTRNKAGASGVEYNKVVSQREGIKDGLTRFNYLRGFGGLGFGIEGKTTSYNLELYPETSLGRTTVRNKIEEDKLLERALGVTCQMLQMQLLWNLKPEYYMTPLELKEKIEARGYDMNELLNTREYWVFLEDEQYEEKQFLSTWDFMEIALGNYHPFWMEEIPAKNPDKEKLEAMRKANAKEAKGNKLIENRIKIAA